MQRGGLRFVRQHGFEEIADVLDAPESVKRQPERGGRIVAAARINQFFQCRWLIDEELMDAHFLQVFDFKLQEIIAAVAGRGNKVVRLANQSRGVKCLAGIVVDQPGNVTVPLVNGVFHPAFEAVADALACPIDDAAETVPATAAQCMAKFPVRQSIAERLDQSGRACVDLGLGAGFNNGRGQ